MSIANNVSLFGEAIPVTLAPRIDALNTGFPVLNAELPSSVVDATTEPTPNNQAEFAAHAIPSVSLAPNVIIGTVGDDQLIGSASADTMFGAAGEDQLLGGAGDDILNGGLGSDTLWGGEGQDTFILTPGEGPDTIADFVEGVDSIQFAGGITSQDVSTIQQGGSTFIRVAATNELLAVLTSSSPLQVIDTPDVSFIVV
jgi:hypothetical protein